MMRCVVAGVAGLVIGASSAWVGAQPVPESVYPPPEPTVLDDPRTATTGVHFDLGVRYATDYIWRGIERFDAGRTEDESNLQFDARLTLDFGKAPHPYVNLFVNTAEGDPVSNFQEVRPEVGFDWNLRPITVGAGYTSYTFPDRDGFDSSEIFLRLTLDDALVFRLERPLLSPYVLGAYDIDKYDGLYVEAGVQHVWPIEETSLTVIANAHAAYVNGYDLFADVPFDDVADESIEEEAKNSGFQHWQVGLTLRYDLNEALNIPDRFGQLAVEGYLNYTGRIDDELRAENQLWGGGGFTLRF